MISFDTFLNSEGLKFLDVIFDKLETYSSDNNNANFSVYHGNFSRNKNFKTSWFYNFTLALCGKHELATINYKHIESTKRNLSLNYVFEIRSLTKKLIQGFIKNYNSNFMIIDNCLRNIDDYALFYNIIENSMCDLNYCNKFPFYLFVNIKNSLKDNIVLENLYKCNHFTKFRIQGYSNVCLYQAYIKSCEQKKFFH